MDIYCITHEKMDFIENLKLIPAAVGYSKCPPNYVSEKIGKNISFKNRNYGEVTFHYWFWKNKLKTYTKNEWFGICHYRRFFVKDNINILKNNEINLDFLKSKIISEPKDEWKGYDAILCEPISLENPKKMKLIKRGFKSLLKNPFIFFDKRKHTIKLHFDMFHGHGNLDKAINMLPKVDKKDFQQYVNNNISFSPNSMYMSNNVEIIDRFYQNLFEWLERCEEIFGFQETEVYGIKRMYAFLTERYTSFWFKKYSKVQYSPWLFKDFTKNN